MHSRSSWRHEARAPLPPRGARLSLASDPDATPGPARDGYSVSKLDCAVPHVLASETARQVAPAGSTRFDSYELAFERTIIAHVPIAEDAAPAHYPSVPHLARALAALGALLRAFVSRVEVVPSCSPVGALVETSSDGLVTLYPQTEPWTQDLLDQLLAHELGHRLSMHGFELRGRALPPWDAENPGWAPWRAACESDGFGPWQGVRRHISEDFVGTLGLYLEARGTPREAELRALIPARTRILSQLVASGAHPIATPRWPQPSGEEDHPGTVAFIDGDRGESTCIIPVEHMPPLARFAPGASGRVPVIAVRITWDGDRRYAREYGPGWQLLRSVVRRISLGSATGT